MNIARIPDNTIKVTNSGTTLYLTILARRIQSQRKNPTLAIPSTMIIIPATNTIVSQLMPLEVSADCPAVYQK